MYILISYSVQIVTVAKSQKFNLHSRATISTFVFWHISKRINTNIPSFFAYNFVFLCAKFHIFALTFIFLNTYISVCISTCIYYILYNYIILVAVSRKCDLAQFSNLSKKTKKHLSYLFSQNAAYADVFMPFYWWCFFS